MPIVKTLYSKNKRGKIMSWAVEVDGARIRSFYQELGGKIVQGAWSVCGPKNVGKSNYISDEHQALIEASALVRKKKKTGKFFETREEAEAYVSHFSPMGALDYQKYKDAVSFPIVGEFKLDGIRGIVNVCGVFSKNGNRFASCDHIYNALKGFFTKYPNAILDGEIYNHAFRSDFNKIVSLTKKQKPSEEELRQCEENLQFHIYDVYIPSQSGLRLLERKKILEEARALPGIINNGFELLKTYEEIELFLSKSLALGYEGVILKQVDSTYCFGKDKRILKYKKFQDKEFVIKDIEPGRGKRGDLATTVVCMLGDGATTFEAGINGDNGFCEGLLKNKQEAIGKLATICYQQLTPGGVPRFGKLKSIRDYE